MLTDPIGDMLIRIKNGYMARLSVVNMPYSKVKENLGKVLLKEGYIKDLKVEGKDTHKKLAISLIFDDNKPKLTDLQRVSKPGVRIYTSKKNIPRVYGGMGTVVLSTPLGIMSGKEAAKKGIGGEIICKVW